MLITRRFHDSPLPIGNVPRYWIPSSGSNVEWVVKAFECLQLRSPWIVLFGSFVGFFHSSGERRPRPGPRSNLTARSMADETFTELAKIFERRSWQYIAARTIGQSDTTGVIVTLTVIWTICVRVHIFKLEFSDITIKWETVDFYINSYFVECN